MRQTLDWALEGPRWPHHEHSRFVEAAGLRWHLQSFAAQGGRTAMAARPGRKPPVALLLHGTGASSHSWRAFAPALAALGFEVLVPDLPGHAFTGLPAAGGVANPLSLPGMARAVQGLLQSLACAPALIVGNSAGAAVALRMVLDGLAAPRLVVAVNGALLPWGGLPGQVFSPAARLLAALPGVPSLFARVAAEPLVLAHLLEGTGSRLDAEGRRLYGLLVRDPGHVAGALGMMAAWDLAGLSRELPRLQVPLLQVVGTADQTVPPRDAPRVEALLPQASRAGVVRLEGLGHLAHEEAPEAVLAALREAWLRLSPCPD